MTSDLKIDAVELPASVSEFRNWLEDYHSEVLGEKIQSWVFSSNQYPGPDGPTYNWTIGDLVVSAKKKDLLQVTFWYHPPSGTNIDPDNPIIPPGYEQIVAETITEAVAYFSEPKGLWLHDLDGFEPHEIAVILVKYYSGPEKTNWKSAEKVRQAIITATKGRGGYTADWVKNLRSEREWRMKDLKK